MLLVALGISPGAFGWAGTLDRPLVGYPEGLDANRQKKAQTALKFINDELKFIDGRFINIFIHHRLGGTSPQTSRFIELFNDAAAWTVHVQFKDFGEQESAFTLDTNMASSDVMLTVNCGRNDFRLKDFQSYLPKPPLPAKIEPHTTK
jgi:hypothetical protein